MRSIKFVVPPKSMKSGDDIFSEKTIKELNKFGFDSELIDFWPDKKAELFYKSKLPYIFDFKFYKWFQSEYYLNNYVSNNFTSGDLAWINANLALCNKNSKFEEILKKKGVKVFFHTMDDWTLVKYGKEVIANRLKYLDGLIVSTPLIKQKYNEVFKDINVYYLKEPIDVNRFSVNFEYDNNIPILVWTGSKFNFTKYFPELHEILEKVNKKIKIKFRVISGSKKPEIPNTNYEYEWLPFEIENEDLNLNGCAIGLSNLNKDYYDACKGNYKVKTYLAKGIPVVGTNWGYNLELIKNGENGFLVNSIEEFAEKIILILKNRLVLNNRDLIREHALLNISHEATIPQWIDFFNSQK